MTDDTRHRMLKLLAASDDGCTDVLLLMQGFAIETIAEMVRVGLASVHPGDCSRAKSCIQGFESPRPGRRMLAEAGELVGMQGFTKPAPQSINPKSQA